LAALEGAEESDRNKFYVVSIAFSIFSGSVDILPVRGSEEGFFDCASRPEIKKA
jgi:hypothetical protein